MKGSKSCESDRQRACEEASQAEDTHAGRCQSRQIKELEHKKKHGRRQTQNMEMKHEWRTNECAAAMNMKHGPLVDVRYRNQEITSPKTASLKNHVCVHSLCMLVPLCVVCCVLCAAHLILTPTSSGRAASERADGQEREGRR